MSGPAFSYAELVVLALAIPFAPILAWILSDTFDAFLRWLTDAPDCSEESSQ